MLTWPARADARNPANASGLSHSPLNVAQGCEHFRVRGDLPNRGHGKKNVDARSILLHHACGLHIPLLLVIRSKTQPIEKCSYRPLEARAADVSMTHSSYSWPKSAHLHASECEHSEIGYVLLLVDNRERGFTVAPRSRPAASATHSLPRQQIGDFGDYPCD